MILVIGARSATGRELVRLLRSAGETPRVMTRTPGPDDGPDTVQGDIAKPATLDRAMAGADKVFLLSSPHHDERAWHGNVIEAAARAGVAHLVRSSILGADPASPARFLRHHGQADQQLRKSGVPWTVLRPNFYMHNVGTGWPAALDPEGNYRAPAGDALISMVDARDVAAAAFHALTGTGHAGQAYDLTGPQAVGHAEACSLLGEHLGRPVRYVPVDDESTRAALIGAGLKKWFADALVELYQDYRRSGRDGYAARIHPDLAEVTGNPPRTLRESFV